MAILHTKTFEMFHFDPSLLFLASVCNDITKQLSSWDVFYTVANKFLKLISVFPEITGVCNFNLYFIQHVFFCKRNIISYT